MDGIMTNSRKPWLRAPVQKFIEDGETPRLLIYLDGTELSAVKPAFCPSPIPAAYLFGFCRPV